MKITLVGTGCIYTKENSACTLINDDLIVDMPNGTLKELLKKGYDVTKIKTVVVTHLHGDHTADIPFFLKLPKFRTSKNEKSLIYPIFIMDFNDFLLV